MNIKGNRLNVTFLCNKNGAFILVLLGDEGELCQVENLVGTNYRVECSEAGIVAIDAVSRDANSDQIFSHSAESGFIDDYLQSASFPVGEHRHRPSVAPLFAGGR